MYIHTESKAEINSVSSGYIMLKDQLIPEHVKPTCMHMYSLHLEVAVKAQVLG